MIKLKEDLDFLRQEERERLSPVRTVDIQLQAHPSPCD